MTSPELDDGAVEKEPAAASRDGAMTSPLFLGASSGIGAEMARGAHVVMAVRNLAAAEAVRQAVLAETPGASVEVMELDLSSLASVRKFAADFAASGLPLNILIQGLSRRGSGSGPLRFLGTSHSASGSSSDHGVPALQGHCFLPRTRCPAP
ncbi:short-chain dehydrogenase TIC 32, chloroplastic isoform X2 [Triticum aestivum]|uniref:short-chain dehydrogenase TIC 32, chloroplastic isoform X2 n=1 Tax=Triticum aestivum TaxID=4565 RepID=UPI001D031005|nr:short-chain dehydrogenase TIC 32, chloroplastic-like isoform X2 [Triticum aestivum]